MTNDHARPPGGTPARRVPGGGSDAAPRVEPYEVDDVKILTVGTVLFALAFVALVPFRGALSDAGRGTWPWIALAGAVLGLWGVLVTRRRRARRLGRRPRQ